MRDVNKVVLRGVVSDAPRTKEFGDGRKVVNLNVKTVTIESDETGAMRERPAWHRVAVGGERSVESAERLAPDSPVYVEGRLRTRKYRNQEGEDMYFTEIRAEVLRETESAEPHINRSIVLGNLGQTPELRKFDNFMVMNLSVATSESWSRRDGETGEETEWHKVALFGEAAQRLEGQLEKGHRVLVDGLLQTRKYNDRSGRERRVTETRAHSVLGSGGSRRSGGHESASPTPSGGTGAGSGMREKQNRQDAWGSSGVDTRDDGGDDVPF